MKKGGLSSPAALCLRLSTHEKRSRATKRLTDSEELRLRGIHSMRFSIAREGLSARLFASAFVPPGIDHQEYKNNEAE